MAALTFDDGPDARWTPRVLDALGEAGAVATFFVMAGRARRHPGLIERARAEGHAVEFHCLRHERHTEISRERAEGDTDSGLSALGELGVEARRWRPPWGALAPWTGELARSRALELTGWTLDTEDWAGHSAARMLDAVRPGLEHDPVVLMHDGLGPGATRDGCAETAKLVAPLVRELRAAGSDPVPLDDRSVPVPWPR